MKQDTTQATPFELVYSRTATLLVEIKINTYLTEPITEENFQETLLRRTYDLMETLENKQRRAADNIQKSQEKQKERHDNQLSDKPVEFKIGDKDRPEILLNKAIDMVTSNQLGKITNAQFEELQTQIIQVILENKIQEILQEGELNKLDFNRAQY
ncbi:hypothetical protein G9A89_006626 [Geosiphon pyriformis]|nr:hypothetical protein G9A89_006626 [Geosiphon pyriformis]